MEKAASNQEKYISDFRLREYGIGGDGRQKKEFAPISRKLKNSIELLSTGLYAKDIHFILELIQNAEDNNYKESSPELEFLILDEDPTNTPGSQGCLCVFNNEIGFAEPNVESICGIGQSTKDRLHGYIGEKGIGFKSVFIVSSQPHIYSNGFRFCFKEDDPDLELAYIVPYWLDCVPDVIRVKRANTAILLPLKEGKKAEIIAELERIEPETILFLAKLEGLAIEVQENSKKIELIRDKSAAPITDLLVQINCQQDHVSRYWMHEEDVAVPANIRDDKRSGVNDRTISVAFPLDTADDRGKIFAFLPTDVDSGFPFIVNADFILSASRETIQTSRKWNEWLRDSLAPAILNGIKQLLGNEKHKVMAYRFIPLTKNLQSLREFFSPVCKAIHAYLSDSEVVLSDRGVFNRPEVSRLASKRVRHLFNNERRPSAFNSLSFVDSGIEKYSEQLKVIGVKAFLAGDLKQCLSDREWLKDQNSDWFVELYTYLYEVQKAGNSMVKRLPIILLDCGDVVSPSSGAVYIPTDKSAVNRLKLPLTTIGGPVAAFLHVTVHEALEASPELREWAKSTLGLLEFNISGFIVNTLVPWADDHANDCTVDDVMQLTQYVLDNWKQFEENDLTVFKQRLPVVLEGGQIHKRSTLKGHELLTPKGLDPVKGWQLFLTNEEDYAQHDVLADKYLGLKADIEILNGFLDGIGGQKYPDLKQYSFPNYYNYNDSPYKRYLSKYASYYPSNFTSTPVLISWMPPASFLDEAQLRKKKYRSALLLWLENMLGFPGRLDSLNRAMIKWFYYTGQANWIESGLHYYLLTTAWINTNKGYKKPGEVFVKSKQLSEMFGAQLPFLKDEISPKLCEYLGIKTEATTESIVEYLKVLSADDEVDLKLVCRLYKYLDGYGKDYVQNFSDYPLIYLPGSWKGWFKSDEVVWEDLSSVFGNFYPGLGLSYESQDLKSFFLKKLAVSETVGAEELARAWLSLEESGESDPDKVKTALEKIFPKILEVASSDEDKPGWWYEFVENANVWTQDGRFISADRALAADDRQLQRFFTGKISFVWKPERYTHQEILPLYRELGVGSLSEATEITLKSSSECHEVNTPSVLTKHTKRLLTYLVYGYSREFFLDQVDVGALKALVWGIECECDAIEVQYAVKGFLAQKTDNERNAFWDTETYTLYLLVGANLDDLLDEAAEAVAKAIWGAKYRQWDDAVRRVLGVTSESRYKKLHDQKGWHMPPADFKHISTLIDRPRIEFNGNVNEERAGVEKEPETKEPPVGSDQEESSTIGEEQGSDVNVSSRARSEPQTHPEPGSQPNSRQHAEQRQGLDSQSPDSPEGAAAETSVVTGGHEGGSPLQTGGTVATGRAPLTGRAPRRSTPRSGRSRSRSTSNRINSARQSRIVSYPYPEPQERDTSPEALQWRKILGDKAELHILKMEQGAGNIAKRMPPNHAGYDIESVVRSTGEVRYIEVKGQQSEWGARGVGLTHTQFKAALDKGKSYWLYVVENVDSDNPRVFRVNDPAHRATEYRFDSNWSLLAAPDETGQVVVEEDLDALVDELKSYTEHPGCKDIIAQCHLGDLVLPEVGYELASDTGEVLGEVELAWPNDLVAVALPAQEEAAKHFKASDWQVFSAGALEDDAERGTFYAQISSIEDTVE